MYFTSILALSLLSDLNKKLLYLHFIISIQHLYLYGPGDHVKSLQNMGYLKLQNAAEDGVPSSSAARRTICTTKYGRRGHEGVVEYAVQLECHHVAESGCLEKWFSEANTCPFCRRVLLPAISGESLMASQIEPQPAKPPAWSPPFEPSDDVLPGITGEPQIAGQIEPQPMDPAVDRPRFQVWSSPIEPAGEWAQATDGSDPFAFRPPGAWAQAGEPSHPNDSTYGHSFQSTDLTY